MRMERHLFTAILQSITGRIMKQDTRCWVAIPSSDRLAVTLHYLAIGECVTSIHYQFRMGKSTNAQIIPEVCSAILLA